MKLHNAFPSEYLTAAEVAELEEKAGDAGFFVTIASAQVEALQLPGASTKEDGITLSFKAGKKRLVCNKTNWRRIVSATGKEDSDDWVGARIRLTTELARNPQEGLIQPSIRVYKQLTAKEKRQQLTLKTKMEQQ